MTSLTRTLSEIKWWWNRVHSPLNKLPDWRKGNEAERNARSRNCTRDIGKARQIKRESVHADLAAALYPDEGDVSRAEDRDRLRQTF